MSRRLSTKRAAKARAWVTDNRCSVRPGITHWWGKGQLVALWPGDRQGYEFTCRKCHEIDSPA